MWLLRSAGQEQGESDLLFGRDAAGDANPFRAFDLFAPGTSLSGAQDLVGHGGIHRAGRHGIHLDVVIPHFDGQILREAHDRGL